MKLARKRKTNDITYMQNLKYGTDEPIYKTETDSQTQRTDLWLPRGRRKEWIDREFGVSRCKLHVQTAYCIWGG